MSHQLLEQPFGMHSVHLRPFGQSLSEEDHDHRRDEQGERVTKRIQEIMDSPDPLTGLFQAKLAHKGTGHDALFDEAIEECKKVFNFDSVAVKSASMIAMQREQERKAKIRESARAAARRAGLEVEDDDPESLIPKPRAVAPKRVAATPAKFDELKADQIDMGFDPETAAKIAQARLEGKFGESGRYITKKENNNAGANTGGTGRTGEAQ